MEGPACLSGVQAVRTSVIGEILVVAMNCGGVERSLEVVSPFLKSMDDGEEFSVVDLIVAFSGGERFRDEGDRVVFSVRFLL